MQTLLTNKYYVPSEATIKQKLVAHSDLTIQDYTFKATSLINRDKYGRKETTTVVYLYHNGDCVAERSDKFISMGGMLQMVWMNYCNEVRANLENDARTDFIFGVEFPVGNGLPKYKKFTRR